MLVFFTGETVVITVEAVGVIERAACGFEKGLCFRVRKKVGAIAVRSKGVEAKTC